MSEQPRLSEMIGLNREVDRRQDRSWPLDLVLAVLGGTTLWMAFRYLDPNDTRINHNPWSYAIVVPLGLVLVSITLRTLVSRLVERSIQLAFVTSLAVHMFFLICALDIIILPRLLPDLFENIKRQRVTLQQQQKIPLYFKLASGSKGKSRPDYLRFMPTRHRATELDHADSAMLQLAKTEQAELASLSPREQISSMPFLNERRQPAPAPLQSSDSAAPISRSEIEFKLDARRRIPESIEAMPSPTASQSLAANAAALARNSKHRTELPAPRSSSELEKPAQSPRLPPEIRRQPARTEAANTAALERRSATRPSKQGANDETSSLVRPRVAGGEIGAAPNLSLPIQGLPSVGASDISNAMRPNLLADTSSRESPLIRAPSSMHAIGLPQSPEYSGLTRVQSGTDGFAATTLAPRSNGRAATVDVAGLTGGDREIQRSAIGLASPLENRDAPVIAEVPDSQSLADLRSITDAKDSSSVPALSSAPADHRTPAHESLSSNQANQVPEFPIPVSPSLPPHSRLNRAANALLPEPAVTSRAQSTSKADSTSDLLQRGPVSARVQVDEQVAPNDAHYATPQLLDSLAVNGSANGRRTSRTTTSRNFPLEIDAELGVGGLASEPSRALPLIVRADAPARSLATEELFSQRFGSNDAGGPLARGANLPLPKPAFQQRLQRLADESLGNNSQVGPLTEIAIERGLTFLAGHQRPDGRWRLQDFDTTVLIRSDTAAIGLALLAFQGAGYTHQRFKHAEVVDKGLRYLITHQKSDGDLYIPQDPASDQNAWLYSHAIATLALCEAFGMTQDESLRTPAQKAVTFMVASQDPKLGGWRYRPTTGTDTSVSGWFTMALRSAQLAGLSVPDETFQRLGRFLDLSRHSREKPHLFRYHPFATEELRHGLEPTAVMTSVGLLMRMYLGWRRSQPEMMAGADYLLQHPPEVGTRKKSLRDTYYWYYATQVLFHMGGERWKQWQTRLHAILIQDQITQGEMAGSWDPYHPTPDQWASYGGRLYVTTMNLLSLEVNYRHLPLYDMTAK